MKFEEAKGRYREQKETFEGLETRLKELAGRRGELEEMKGEVSGQLDLAQQSADSAMKGMTNGGTAMEDVFAIRRRCRELEGTISDLDAMLAAVRDEEKIAQSSREVAYASLRNAEEWVLGAVAEVEEEKLRAVAAEHLVRAFTAYQGSSSFCRNFSEYVARVFQDLVPRDNSANLLALRTEFLD